MHLYVLSGYKSNTALSNSELRDQDVWLHKAKTAIHGLSCGVFRLFSATRAFPSHVLAHRGAFSIQTLRLICNPIHESSDFDVQAHRPYIYDHTMAGMPSHSIMIAMMGTSDRLCWLAESCKILLLLPLHLVIHWLIGPCGSAGDIAIHMHTMYTTLCCFAQIA